MIAAKNVSVFGVILVRIFSGFSSIRTEYGEILRISPYSVRMQENVGNYQENAKITPNTDSFYAVDFIYMSAYIKIFLLVIYTFHFHLAGIHFNYVK